MTTPITSASGFHDPEVGTNVGEMISEKADISDVNAGSGESEASNAGDACAIEQRPGGGDAAEGHEEQAEFGGMRDESDAGDAEEGRSWAEALKLDKLPDALKPENLKDTLNPRNWHESIEQLPRNVGQTEQMIRMGSGAALLAAAAFAPMNRSWRIGLAAFGAAELVTGALGYCPLWQALGVNTCERDEQEA